MKRLTDEELDQQMDNLLNSYLVATRPAPDTQHGDYSILDYKTTADIRQDLLDMMDVPPAVIFAYLVRRGYDFTTLNDGRVAWAIWRQPPLDR